MSGALPESIWMVRRAGADDDAWFPEFHAEQAERFERSPVHEVREFGSVDIPRCEGCGQKIDLAAGAGAYARDLEAEAWICSGCLAGFDARPFLAPLPSSAPWWARSLHWFLLRIVGQR